MFTFCFLSKVTGAGRMDQWLGALVAVTELQHADDGSFTRRSSALLNNLGTKHTCSTHYTCKKITQIQDD